MYSLSSRMTELIEQTVVAAFISEMMKDPRIWPDPDDFIPERWLHEYKGVEADRKAFVPFSAGSRNCIGQQYVFRSLPGDPLTCLGLR